MLFKEFGDRDLPTIILLHGGGLSWWSLNGIVEQLRWEYHVVTPIIDGHGEDGHETFESIEKSAGNLLSYIDDHHGGKVFALSGLSIGAQIVTEVLSIRSDVAEYAIIESALVFPIKGITAMTTSTYQLFYGLIKQKWFSKMQAKALLVPESMFERYYEDSLRMTKQSLINMSLSNGRYSLRDTISATKAKVLLIVGEKEIGIMKKSTQRLHEAIQGSELHAVPSMGHGEISLVHPDEYVRLLREFIAVHRSKGGH